MSDVVNLADYGREQFDFGFPERFAGRSREKSQAPILSMGTDQATTALHGSLRRELDGQDSPVKRVAKGADVNLRTAENYWDKKNLPGLVPAIRLMATMPEFAAEVLRLAGLQTNLDPRLDRAINDLMRAAFEAKGGRQ